MFRESRTAAAATAFSREESTAAAAALTWCHQFLTPPPRSSARRRKRSSSAAGGSTTGSSSGCSSSTTTITTTTPGGSPAILDLPQSPNLRYSSSDDDTLSPPPADALQQHQQLTQQQQQRLTRTTDNDSLFYRGKEPRLPSFPSERPLSFRTSTSTTTTTPTAAAAPPLPTRSGLFRRLQRRRARRIAEYEAAVTNLRYLQELPYSPPKNAWRCLPAEHPGKLCWDFLTAVLSLVNAYLTHAAIRDRNFDTWSNFKVLTEIWFAVDILLNFVTEHKLGAVTLRTVSAVSARYLTTWFVIDALSLVPGEWLFVRPVIQRQKARGWFKRWLLRGHAVTRVSGKLWRRWSTVRSVSAAYRKRAGLGGVARLVRACVKYIPKYLLFVRNMKGVVAVRILRQVHWMRKVYYNLTPARSTSLTMSSTILKPQEDDDSTDSLTYYDDAAAAGDDDDDFFHKDGAYGCDDDDDDASAYAHGDEHRVVLFDEDSFLFDEDDDDDSDDDDGGPY